MNYANKPHRLLASLSVECINRPHSQATDTESKLLQEDWLHDVKELFHTCVEKTTAVFLGVRFITAEDEDVFYKTCRALLDFIGVYKDKPKIFLTDSLGNHAVDYTETNTLYDTAKLHSTGDEVHKGIHRLFE